MMRFKTCIRHSTRRFRRVVALGSSRRTPDRRDTFPGVRSTSRVTACALVIAGLSLTPLFPGVGQVAAAPTAGSSAAAPTVGASTAPLQRLGTVDLEQVAAANPAPLSTPSAGARVPTNRAPLGLLPHPPGPSTARAPSTSPINFGNGNVLGETGFDGITGAVNGSANSPEIGGIGDVSPPDQGLAVGPSSAGTVLVEFVNDTLNIYSTSGATLLGALPAFEVFDLPPNTFLSDPRAYWDPSSGHWFLTMFDVGNSGGTITNGECSNYAAPPNCLSTQYIAVSNTTDPFGAYTVFTIDTSDSSNTANGCPCFGDFDMVGADGSGFYISTNEFPLNSGGLGFNGTVIYALSKSGLIAAANGGTTPTVQRYTVPYLSDPFAGYHLSPSTVTQGSSSPNTEYFVESNANLPNDAIAQGLEVFALLNTSVLAQGGRPTLMETPVNTESYTELPPNATQKSGPTPFGTANGYTGTSTLQTDFSAVQEVTYASGSLYAELDTGVTVGNLTNSGAAWFVLHPTAGATSLVVTNAANGYLATTENVLYPVIGVDASGQGYMAFAVSGPDMYPSAAFIAFHGTHGPVGQVDIAAAGTAPLDDFTCYPPYSSFSCRYGDYSMAQQYNGHVYMATEYVAPQPRDVYVNWGTRVYSAPNG